LHVIFPKWKIEFAKRALRKSRLMSFALTFGRAKRIGNINAKHALRLHPFATIMKMARRTAPRRAPNMRKILKGTLIRSKIGTQKIKIVPSRDPYGTEEKILKSTGPPPRNGGPTTLWKVGFYQKRVGLV